MSKISVPDVDGFEKTKCGNEKCKGGMGLSKRKSKHLCLPELEKLDRSEALCCFWNC